MAFGAVMQPAGLNEVSALLIREERSRSGVVLEIRKQIDDVELEVCGGLQRQFKDLSDLVGGVVQ